MSLFDLHQKRKENKRKLEKNQQKKED